MGNHRANEIREQSSKPLVLTPDERAVVEAIRETPFGEVAAETRNGAIVNIRKHETRRPPSLLAREAAAN